MQLPQHTFRRRKSHELHPSYRNEMRENRDLSGVWDVHPIRRDMEPRLRVGTCAEMRGYINIGLPISKHPPEVGDHQTFGHRELDTVVFGRGKSKACVATFIERKKRASSISPCRSQTEARSSAGTNAFGGRSACHSISPPRTRPGKGGASRTPTESEKVPELENRTGCLHRGNVALNLTNRHMNYLVQDEMGVQIFLLVY